MKSFNLYSKPSCQTLSNAWAISKKSPEQYSLFSRAVEISSVRRWTWWIVECLFLNPNWLFGMIWLFWRMGRSLFRRVFSKSLPRTGSKLMGRYDEDKCLGFFGFGYPRFSGSEIILAYNYICGWAMLKFWETDFSGFYL